MRLIQGAAIGSRYLPIVFASVIRSCNAQQTIDSNVSVQAVIFVIVAGTTCCMFWVCYACMYFSRQKCATPSSNQLPSVHYSSNTHRTRIETSNYVPPHSVLRQSYQMGEPSGSHSDTARVDPLLEASLHQRDAPPTYEEAIKMMNINLY